MNIYGSLMDIFDQKNKKIFDQKNKDIYVEKNALTTSRQKLHKLFFAEKRLICPEVNKSAFRF